MTLDQLVSQLGALRENALSADAKLIKKFEVSARDWLTDGRTARKLVADFNRLLGHIWLSKDETHAQVHESIRAFATEVADIGGMTVNERLYCFGLSDRWDAGSPQDQKTVRHKVEVD